MNKGLMTPEDMSKFGLNDQVHRPSSLCNPTLDATAFKCLLLPYVRTPPHVQIDLEASLKAQQVCACVHV